MAANDFAALRNLTAPNTEKEWDESIVPEDYDIDHFDYAYVKTCTDTRELRQILTVLRSGKEGLYPDLENAVERRIVQLGGKVLGRPNANLSTSIDPGVARDFKDWFVQANDMDARMSSTTVNRAASRQQLSKTMSTEVNMSSVNKKTTDDQESGKMGEKIMAGDYRAWDKLNIDNITLSTSKDRTIFSGYNSNVLDLPTDVRINPKWTDEQIKRASETENIKGNEAIKAGDYEEAIRYYTRALNVHAEPKYYGNRSLAYLKLNMHTACIEDATAAIQLQPDMKLLFKCYYRRGNARFKIGEYENAFDDYRKCEEIHPNDPGLCQQRKESEAKWMRVDLPRYRQYTERHTRQMIIEEVDDSNEEDVQQTPEPNIHINKIPETIEQDVDIGPMSTRQLQKSSVNTTTSANKLVENPPPPIRGKKIKVEIVEDEDSDDDDAF